MKSLSLVLSLLFEGEKVLDLLTFLLSLALRSTSTLLSAVLAAEANRPLAVGLGLLLPAVGLLAYLIPDSDPVTKTDGHDSSP